MNQLSHLDKNGSAKMVDVGDKTATKREAVACGSITIKKEVISLLKDRNIPKGDVLAAARIAGIMAAKKVDSLIPLCHTIAIDAVSIAFKITDDAILIKASASSSGKTGVEMEALTAVSVSALTIYDMCKAVDKGMVIGSIFLLEKSGGRSGLYRREDIAKEYKDDSEWL